jgi:hypothetical protein
LSDKMNESIPSGCIVKEDEWQEYNEVWDYAVDKSMLAVLVRNKQTKHVIDFPLHTA